MNAIAAINMARTSLGMEEPDYRALLQRVTGKASLKLMSPAEHGRVLAELRTKGAPAAPGRLAGPYGGKLQALWLSGWNLGLVHNRADAALLAFVRAQTGIDHTRFLRDPKDARKAVEALKQWLSRDGGVVWSDFADPKDCVIAAQLALLAGSDRHVLPSTAVLAWQEGRGEESDKVALMQRLGTRIRARRSPPDA